MIVELKPTKYINQSTVLRVFCWFPLITIKDVYLFDEISCKMHHDMFYMVLSLYVFAKPSFSFFSENKLADVSWILSYSLDCIVLTLDVSLLTLSIVFSIVVLYLVLHQLFIKFSTSKRLCYQKDLLQNQNKRVVI